MVSRQGVSYSRRFFSYPLSASEYICHPRGETRAKPNFCFVFTPPGAFYLSSSRREWRGCFLYTHTSSPFLLSPSSPCPDPSHEPVVQIVFLHFRSVARVRRRRDDDDDDFFGPQFVACNSGMHALERPAFRACMPVYEPLGVPDQNC